MLGVRKNKKERCYMVKVKMRCPHCETPGVEIPLPDGRCTMCGSELFKDEGNEIFRLRK